MVLFPHISVWGSSFVGCHPARIRPSFLPSLRPPRPLTHSLTHSLHTHTPSSLQGLSHSLTQSLTHLLTHSLTHCTLTLPAVSRDSVTHSLSHSLTCSHTHSHSQSQSLTHSLSHSLTHTPRASHSLARSLTHSLTLPEPVTHSLTQSLTHSQSQSLTHSLTQSLTRSLTHSLTLPEPVIQRPEGAAACVVAAGPPSLSAVAGAVPRASRRGCGVRCRRSAPLALCSGRRSTQSLQKGLRRALSPLGPPRSLQRQAQYPEPPEGAAARVVAAGPPAVLCVTAIVSCKAMVVTGCESHCNGCGQDVRTLCLCTTAIVISIVLVLAGSESHCKCCEKDVCEVCLCTGAIVICRTSVCAACSHSQSLSSRDCRRGCGARCRRWAPLSLCSGRRSTQSLQKGLRRALSPLGPPRSLQWQAQYPEPPEGAAARVVAAGPPSLSAVAGAVPRASRRGCGARCRRWAPLALCSGRRSTQSLQKGLRRALSALGPLRFCALLPL